MKQVVITLLALLAVNFIVAQNDLTAFANKRTGSFTENLGQILDQNGNPVPDVLAKGSLPGLDIYITKTGLTYALLQYEEDVTALPHPVYVTNNKRYKVTCSRVDVELAGAVLNKEQLQFGNAETYSAGYYYGDVQIPEAAQYKQLTIKNVYPGIDWVWKINAQGKAEYDFVVQPGADVNAIRMKYRYADITAGEKELKIATRLATIREGDLQAHAGGKQIEAAYLFNADDKSVSFKLGKYDAAKELIIDPPISLQWNAQYGGNFADGLRGVETDAQGNAYLVGYTTSTNFPVFAADSLTYRDSTFNGNVDVILLKVAANQNLLWATYLGGPGNDWGNSVSVSMNGDIFITGSAESGYPTQAYNYAYNGTYTAGSDIFITRFNSNRRMLWSTFFGGTGTDEALKIHCSNDFYNNYFWLTGYTKSGTSFPISNYYGLYQKKPQNGYENPFILKFSPNFNNLEWATALPDTANSYGTALCIATGKLTVAGFSSGPRLNYFGGNPTLLINNGGIDGFITQFTNTPLFERFIGGSGNDYITDIAPAPNNSYVITGYTNSSNFPVKQGLAGPYFQSALAGGYDAFISKFSNDTVLSWSTYYGGTGSDAATGIDTGQNSSLLLTGFTFSTDFPTRAPANGGYFQGNNKGAADGFISSFTEHGLRTYSAYKGDSCYEYPLDIAATRDGSRFYVCGEGLFACNQSLPGGGSSPTDTATIGGDGLTSGFCWSFDGSVVTCFNVGITTLLHPCPGVDNGYALVNYSGGTAPYSVTWSNIEHTDTAFSLAAGQNFVFVTDSAGCGNEANVKLKPLQKYPGYASVDCYNPTIVIGAPGYDGNRPYTYLWNTGDTTGTITATVGSYNTTITDTRGCTVVGSVQISWRDIIDTIITVARNPGCLLPNGVLVAKNGYTPVVVKWYNSNNQLLAVNDSLYNVAPGTYYIAADNCINGQIVVPSVTLTDPGITQYINVEIYGPPLACVGTTNIRASVDAYPNSNGLDYYEWSNGYTGLDNSIAVSSPQIYTVTVTTAIGCTATASVDLRNYDVIDTTDAYFFPPSCINAHDGYLGFGVTDGYAEYYGPWGSSFKYEWTSDNGFKTTRLQPYLDSIAPGIYYLHVTDLNTGCTADFYWNLNLYQRYEVDVIGLPAGCGANSGSITVTSHPWATIYWVDTIGNGIIISDSSAVYNLAPGTYTGYWQYETMCVVIGQEPGTVNLQIDSVRFNCRYGNELLANVSNGTPPYTYTWSSGATSSILYPLAAGPYVVTVRDSLGCVLSDTADYLFVRPLSSTFIRTELCNSDSTDVTILPRAGHPPYSGDTGTHRYGNTPVPVTISDAIGCTVNYTIRNIQHNYLRVTYTKTASTCNTPGTVAISASGGKPPYTGTGIFALAPGLNLFAVRDSVGCTDTIRIIDSINTLLLNYTIKPVSCSPAMSEVRIVPFGGTPPYSGDTGRFMRAAGNYNFVVSDAGGCSNTVQVVVTDPAPLQADYSVNTINCFGGTATVNITATGGATPYNNAVGPHILPAGPYTYVVTDNVGCTDTVEFVVTQPTSTVQLNYTLQNALCFGGNGSINLSAEGGTPTYTYTNGQGGPVAAGTYIYAVSDANGCTDSVHIAVTQPAQLHANYSAGNIACNGGNSTITVAATGGTNPYSGDTGQYVLSAGTYSFIVSDINGCTDTATLIISEPEVLHAQYTSTAIACYGDNAVVTVTATGGTLPYSGDIGTYTQPAGSNTFIVMDSAGCTDTLVVTVTEPSSPLLLTPLVQNASCYGSNGAITLSTAGGTPPYNYPAGTGGLQAAGMYTYTVIDTNGCTDTAQVTITEPTALELSYTTTPIACHGQNATITISATNGTPAYSGDTGTHIVPAGNYVYTVYDAMGCIDSAHINITEPTELTFSVEVEDTLNCNAASAQITVNTTGGTPPYLNSGTFTIATDSAYNLQVTDNNGCIASTNLLIDVPGGNIEIAGATENVCRNSNVQLSASGNYNFTWNGNSTGNTFAINDIQATTTVVLNAYDSQHNCSLTDTALITVIQCVGIENINADNLFSVYPNPANSLLFLTTKYAVDEKVLIKMFAADGKLVTEQQMNKGETRAAIDCQQWASGTYMLQCSYAGNVVRYKIIVNH